MPVVNLKVLGTLTEDQKSQISQEFTETLRRVAGKPPEYTYVIIEEVPPTNWAHKGELFSR
ncbi:MAG: tautomerase family protein [Bacteroidota bacterium]